MGVKSLGGVKMSGKKDPGRYEDVVWVGRAETWGWPR